MRQLKMLRPAAPVIPRPLPEGYTYASYRGTKAEVNEWLEVCRHGLLPENPPPNSRDYRDWYVSSLHPKHIGMFYVAERRGRRSLQVFVPIETDRQTQI